jgi:CheY-like chemotaxis protein
MADTMARILVIDNDTRSRQSIRQILESEHFNIEMASDGEEGLRSMREQIPDLVILDVMLTHMLEGIAIIREMLSDPQLVVVPVIIVSSIDRKDYEDFLPVEDPCLNTAACLSKPVEPEELLSTVRHALTTPLRCEWLLPLILLAIYASFSTAIDLLSLPASIREKYD